MSTRIGYAQSTAVYFNYSLAYAIENLGELGYDGVEIWGGRPHFYRDDLSSEIPALKALLDRYRLSICNFIPAQFRYPSLLCSASERIRADSVDYIATAIKNAAALGSPSVSLCPGMVPWDHAVTAGRAAFMRSLRELSLINQAFGLRLLIEPAHRFESNLILTIGDALAMLADLDDPAFGILLDVGHCYLNGESLGQALRDAARHHLHIHIDDNDGSADTHLIPGEGSLDFSELPGALREIGYTGLLSVELGASYNMHPESACQRALMAMRKLMAG